MQPRLGILAVLLLAPVFPLTGQDHSHDHAYPAAPPEKLGRVVFPAGCGRAVQPKVERAVALLHSFWYEEAETAFGEVVAADSGCALGHWGQAMSLLHPLWTPPTDP